MADYIPWTEKYRPSSLKEVVGNLTLVSDDGASETLRQAGKLLAELQYGCIDEILTTGLHAFLTQFLERVSNIGERIGREFLVSAPA